MSSFKKRKKYWWEEDEEDDKEEYINPENFSLRQELERAFNDPQYDKEDEDENIFKNIDTSNMNLRQELEAKFNVLNQNPYQTMITPELFYKADNDNVFDDKEDEEEKQKSNLYLITLNTPIQNINPLTDPTKTDKELYEKNIRNCSKIDDIYYSANGKINTKDHEGGYNFARKNDAGGPTNYGITQSALDEYKNFDGKYRQVSDFPTEVKNLSNNQAKQILDEMYFKRYAIDKLCNKDIARNVFDVVMSTTNKAPQFLADAVNEIKNTDFKNQGIISNDLAKFVNQNLTEDEVTRINNLITQKGMDYYFKSVDRRPKNINNLNGWYNRRKNYYSDPEEFDRLFKELLEEYFKKYGAYYNGK